MSEGRTIPSSESPATADLYDRYGDRDVPVPFGNCAFHPGDQVYSDGGGAVVLPVGEPA